MLPRCGPNPERGAPRPAASLLRVDECERLVECFRPVSGQGRSWGKPVCVPVFEDVVSALAAPRSSTWADLTAGEDGGQPLEVYGWPHWVPSLGLSSRASIMEPSRCSRPDDIVLARRCRQLSTP